MRNPLKRIALPLPVVVALIIAGIAVSAAIVASFKINTSIQILANYGIEVYDTDHTTPLASLDFGQYFRDDPRKRFPEVGTYFIDSHEGKVWLSYSLTGWPAGVTFELFARKVGGTYEPLNAGVKTSFSLNGESAEWYVLITAGASAEFGSFSPEITWNGHDTG